ncbi:MAG: hypothetical protein A3G75_15155 [Verrucomicrobia bacterium RIFCSPLOWO2_12_FULL_64_8]|nr:MAG: hypothetical protein A3G75_15155 [Verrucomicrobia bacterium RIFCSPLOWO2_12_FULL_64_8]
MTMNFGAAHVACARFLRAASGTLTLEKYALEPLPGAAEMDDQEWLGAISAVLGDFQARGDFQGPGILILPGHLSMNRVVRMPRVEPAQMRRIVEFEARQLFSPESGELVWSNSAATPADDGLETVLSAVRRPVLEELCSRMDATGFTPAAAVPAWAAVCSAGEYNHPEAAGGMMLNVGARTSHFIVSRGPRLLTRIIALGGNMVTGRIAAELEVDFATAERIKRKAGGATSFPPPPPRECMAVQLATEEFARRLGGEIARSIAGLIDGNLAGRPSLLLLSGGGSRLEGLPSLLEKFAGFAIQRHEALRRIELGTAAAAPGTEPDVPPPVELVGAAMLASEMKPGELDLLPADWRRRRALRRGRPLLAAAAVMAVMAPWLPMVVFDGRADAAHRWLGEIATPLKEMQQLEARYLDETGRLTEINRRISALERIHRARTSWLEFLSDLQERLTTVEHIWLEKLEVVAPDSRPAASLPRPASDGMGVMVSSRNAARVTPDATVRLCLAGSLFDPEHPSSTVGPGAYDRAKAFLSGLRESPFVATVENSRFDAGRPGLLQFEVTVVVAPQRAF